MSQALEAPLSSSKPLGLPDEHDDIQLMQSLHWDELFGMERQQVETFQLAAARARFEEIVLKVKALKTRADNNHITRIRTFQDIAPLLFDHSAYKAYPISILEKSRFDLLTRWLDGMTAVDLSGVDASGCDGIDAWIDLLQRDTPLRIYHTTGTSGKLSFIPRTIAEQRMWNESFIKQYEPFGSEAGLKVGGADGARMPVVVPAHRYGNNTVNHIVDFLAHHVAPTEADVHVRSRGRNSADIISLSGRVRIAQAKGELGQLKLTDAMRGALREHLEGVEQRGHDMVVFFNRIAAELRGQQIFMMSQATFLTQAALKAREQGISSVFAADSIGKTGGGDKDTTLPSDWRRIVADYTGFDEGWRISYGMTEVTAGNPLCPAGFYHIPPYSIPYLFDPATGDLLPRSGTQTGRFGVLDLMPRAYWGGVLTGDRVTLEWDRQCACGRKGVHAHFEIRRYDQSLGGDDKITCAATVDNTDIALQQLLKIR